MKVSHIAHNVKWEGVIRVSFSSFCKSILRIDLKLIDEGLHVPQCPPRVFESAHRSFDVALRSSLERIVTASGPGFGYWQWRLATLPFAFGGLGVYSAGDVLNYVFLASRLQSAVLQTKLLCNPSEIAAPKLMKKMADIYFTRVTKNAESTFSLSPRQMALWTSQREDHTSDWLKTVPISGLGQTMNACSRVFVGDIYGDHVVSCAGVIGIKHRHNVVRDTLVDICCRSGVSAGKEVDIGLDRGRDKPLRPADMLFYSWDRGLDVCVDLTGSSALTQTGMVDFVPGRAMINAAQRKRGKYMNKCAAIGYEFLPFSFSSLGELEADAVTLLRRIRNDRGDNVGEYCDCLLDPHCTVFAELSSNSLTHLSGLTCSMMDGGESELKLLMLVESHQIGLSFCKNRLWRKINAKAENVRELDGKLKGICIQKGGRHPTGMVSPMAKAGGFTSVSDMIHAKGAQNFWTNGNMEYEMDIVEFAVKSLRSVWENLPAGEINERLVFVSENQDQISTKNESEVGLAQGRTGVNDTREHVQELERECEYEAAFVASCLQGALTPVDLRAICFVRAIGGD
ncbi:hypothetical protein Tco_0337496 [Tanacetum coccineum]